MGLSYRPTRLQRLSGRYDNPMPESTISPSWGVRICKSKFLQFLSSCQQIFLKNGKMDFCEKRFGYCKNHIFVTKNVPSQFTLFYSIKRASWYTVIMWHLVEMLDICPHPYRCCSSDILLVEHICCWDLNWNYFHTFPFPHAVSISSADNAHTHTHNFSWKVLSYSEVFATLSLPHFLSPLSLKIAHKR